MLNFSKKSDSLNEEELGFKVLKANKDIVEIERRTKETMIKCKVEATVKRGWNIDTGIWFFNHMIEMLAYYSEFNIDLEVPEVRINSYNNRGFWYSIREAFYIMAMERAREYGIRGFGFSQGALDEAC